MHAFVRACAMLGVLFHPPCRIEIFARKFSFFDLTAKFVRKLCSVAAAQSLYSDAIKSARKDLEGWGSGILDVEVSTLPARSPPWLPEDYDKVQVEGILTGACPTANRLHQSNKVDSPACRFCKHQHETIQHLAQDCKGVHELLGNPGNNFPSQPHFLSHGIMEVPQFLLDVVAHSPQEPSPARWDRPEHVVFGGASIANAQHFFSRTMASVVLSVEGNVLSDFVTTSPSASLYEAEILAVVMACRSGVNCLHFITSSVFLKNQWTQLCTAGHVDESIQFANWWKIIWD